MKLLVAPRGAKNPYQSLLYEEMSAYGVQVSYLGEVTRSYTVNLLLMPAELVVRRLAGARLVHLHWTYNFAFLGSARYPFLRHVAQWWFTVWLGVLRLIGLRLAWTAHNVLPLNRVLADDLKARRRLAAAADLVIAHSQATLEELRGLGIPVRDSVVIPHGPYTVTRPALSLAVPGAQPGPRKFLFFGMVSAYKGLDTLLTAFAALPAGLDAELRVVGECADPALRASLTELAARSPRPVGLRFERVPEAEVSALLAGADVVVLPYQKITTSGSAVLALSHGRPLIVPDLPGLSELPGGAVTRYDGTADGLTRVLEQLAAADAAALAAMSAAGYEYCAATSWASIAKLTYDAFDRIAGLSETA